MKSVSTEETIERLIFSLSELEQLGEILISGRGNFRVSSQTYLRMILGTLRVTRGAILLFNPTNHQLIVQSAINVDESLVISVTPDEVVHIRQFSIIDLARPPLALRSFLDRVRPQLQSLGADLWAPLKIRDEFLGIISLGPFFPGVKLEDWDRGLLNVLANQTSIAIAYSRLLEEVRADKFRLYLLSDSTTQLCKRLETEILAEEVVNHAVTLLDAGAGCLMLIDPFTKRLEVKSLFAPESQLDADLKNLSIPLEADANHNLPPSLSRLVQVAVQGETWVCNDEGAALFGRTNLIAAPIMGRESVLGVLVVCDKEGKGGITPDFTEEDENLLEAFANQAGVAMENARLYQEALEGRQLQAEMEEAAKIQANLLPQAPPEIPGYAVYGLSIPRGSVGGDYYDYIQEPNGAWGFAIADVSGKGMQAALLMATLRAGLRFEVARRKELSDIATTLNAFLYESSTIGKFATFFYAQLQPETGGLTSVNAGHNYPLVLGHDGSIKRLEKGGTILGMFPDDMLRQIGAYEQETTQLYSGDTVLFYTDGVTETENLEGEQYGEERLEEVFQQQRHATAAEICTAIHDSVLEFQGEAQQFDDLTLMVLKKE
jgi:sigma-B regulation protein RsbU (phosphoserine phosphatase)